MTQVSDRVRELRLAAGLSQTALAGARAVRGDVAALQHEAQLLRGERLVLEEGLRDAMEPVEVRGERAARVRVRWRQG